MSAETVHEKAVPSTTTGAAKPTQPGAIVSPVLHRVCIQCNNMFPVTPDRFDAKQCPNCHKG